MPQDHTEHHGAAHTLKPQCRKKWTSVLVIHCFAVPSSTSIAEHTMTETTKHMLRHTSKQSDTTLCIDIHRVTCPDNCYPADGVWGLTRQATTAICGELPSSRPLHAFLAESWNSCILLHSCFLLRHKTGPRDDSHNADAARTQILCCHCCTARTTSTTVSSHPRCLVPGGCDPLVVVTTAATTTLVVTAATATVATAATVAAATAATTSTAATATV